MEITKTIPQQENVWIIDAVTIYIHDKTAYVEIKNEDDSTKNHGVEIDLSPVLKNASVEQLQTIRTFIKWILAKAYDVSENSLPNTIF